MCRFYLFMNENTFLLHKNIFLNKKLIIVVNMLLF